MIRFDEQGKGGSNNGGSGNGGFGGGSGGGGFGLSEFGAAAASVPSAPTIGFEQLNVSFFLTILFN